MRRAGIVLASLLLGIASAQSYVFLVSTDRDTLDPLQAYDQASGVVIENVYEGLFGYARDSAQELVPVLATAYEVSDDGLTYTFHLREGVRFHSGNPFTCRDVEYTFERLLVVNPYDSPGWVMAETLIGTWDNADVTLGPDASDDAYAAFWEQIARSVDCVDDMTAVFRLPRPDPTLIAKLAVPSYYVIDSAWAIAHGMWDGTEATWRDWVSVDLREHHLHDHMSGTGAYRLVAWVPGERLVAAAFPDYWGGAPAIEEVVYRIVDDKEEQLRAFLAGEVDRVSLVDRSDFPDLVGHPNVKVFDGGTDPSLGWASVGVWTLYFNQDIAAEDNDAVLHSGRLDGYGIPPDFFSDRHARNCFAFAFDPHELNEVALDGLGTMLTMPLPPSFLGYDPEAPHHTLDLARAEEHCRQAWDGRLWEHGMYVTLPYLEGIDISEQPARMLKRHLEALNPRFTVDLRPASDSEYWPLAGAGKLPVDLAGWLAGFPDPHDFIHPFYASDGWFASQYGYSNPELDALVEEARTHPDPARRAELYARIARIGFEDAPFVVMPEPPVSLVIGSKVEGTYFNPMLNGWFLWKDIRKAE